jgi:hypothetical protein
MRKMRLLNNSLQSSKSYFYLTKNDFIKGFGEQKAVMIVKDFKNIRFNFDSGNDDNSLLLSNHKQAMLRDVHIIGDVLQPTQLKLLNSQEKQSIDSNLLFCLDEDMDDDDEDLKEKKSAKAKISPKLKQSAIGQSLNINLFRRRLKTKKFLELSESERTQLATSVLDVDRFKGKSIFHFVNAKQLVQPNDYFEPDFITLTEPPDTEYEQNYSQHAPSVHDLFDIPVDEQLSLEDTEYEMMEYLDDEEDA